MSIVFAVELSLASEYTEAMVSDKTIADAMEAEIVGGSPGTLLVEYPNGDVESVAESSLHGTMCELSILNPTEPIVGRGRALDHPKFDGDGIDIDLEITPNQQLVGEITVGGRADTVEVTGHNLALLCSQIEELLADDDAVDSVGSGGAQSITSRRRQQQQVADVDQQNISFTNEFASSLYDVYERRIAERVRANAVNQFVDDIEPSKIEIEDNGWIVEGTYLVTFDGAENYLVDDIDQYSVSGNKVVETDSEKQAVGLTFDTEPLAVFEVDGRELSLSSKEQRFLASVNFLLEPSNYLDVDHFEQEVYEAIETAKGETFHNSQIELITRSVNVSHFVDPQSGLLHRHDIDKHVLRSTFKVQRWVIDELDYSSFDHAGLAELAYREQEFRAEDTREVFFDATPNDDDGRWQNINSTEKNAPCPPEVYRKLRAKYGT